MKRFLLTTLILAVGCSIATAQVTDEEAALQQTRVKERLAEHAAEKRAKNTPAPIPENTENKAEQKSDDDDVVTLLPEIIVTSERISDLDIEIKKLNKDIVRAKKKIKPTELDNTLNSDDAPKVLSIFGGHTAGQRKALAAERVNLMEAERDILEAMKYVRTRQEEKQLKEQLIAIKTMSRDLDKDL